MRQVVQLVVRLDVCSTTCCGLAVGFRFIVDLLYNMLYNKLHEKSTTNRSNGVRHCYDQSITSSATTRCDLTRFNESRKLNIFDKHKPNGAVVSFGYTGPCTPDSGRTTGLHARLEDRKCKT